MWYIYLGGKNEKPRGILLSLHLEWARLFNAREPGLVWVVPHTPTRRCNSNLLQGVTSHEMYSVSHVSHWVRLAAPLYARSWSKQLKASSLFPSLSHPNKQLLCYTLPCVFNGRRKKYSSFWYPAQEKAFTRCRPRARRFTATFGSAIVIIMYNRQHEPAICSVTPRYAALPIILPQLTTRRP